LRDSLTDKGSESRRQLKSWGVWLMIPLVILLGVLFMFAGEWRASLKTGRVVVDGASYIPAQQIFSLAKIPLKKPMYEIDLFEVRERVLSQPFIKSVSINRQFPEAIRISVRERVPIALLNCGQLRYVDAEGFLLPYIETSVKLDLPVISGIEGLQEKRIGEAASNDELFQAIALLESAQEIDTTLYHFISEVNMNKGQDITLYSADAGVPIILGRQEISKKLLTLQSFWNNFVKTENSGKMQYVDLRYNDQVVVKWNTENQRQAKGEL